MGSVKCDDVDLGPPARHIGTNNTGTQKSQTWHRELQQCHFPHQLCHLLASDLSPLLCPTTAASRISYDYHCIAPVCVATDGGEVLRGIVRLFTLLHKDEGSDT